VTDDEGCRDRAGRERWWWIAAVALALGAGAIALVASRSGPMLSPDSITYLATADHLRRGLGFTDFTGEAMAVFGPVYPLVLAPGGASLGWVRATGALGAAAVTILFAVLARRRTAAAVALGATAVVAASAATVSVASTAWSETVYTAIGLAMVLVLTGERGGVGATASWRRAAAGGVLAGLGFLTRYAGAGLVLTGLAVVLLAAGAGDARRGPAWTVRARSAAAFLATAAVTVSPWVVRNLAVTGEALGPRFSGGTSDGLGTLLSRPAAALGRVVTGRSDDRFPVVPLGWLVVATVGAALLVVLVQVVRRRPPRAIDVAAVSLAATCIVVPVIARAVTANDIEQRVMSPTFTALVLLGVIAVDSARAARDTRRAWCRRAAAVVAVPLALASVGRGVVVAAEFPDTLWTSSASRSVYSPELHDEIDALPAGVHLLTNNPQRVWWQHRREPTLFAFTRPRAGNSHYPIPADEVLALACDGRTVLAWFDGLLNAGDGPQERRPDLSEVVHLTASRVVAGGTLYEVEPVDRTRCSNRST